MELNWIISFMFCITGALVAETQGTEKENSTENSVGHSSDDYDPNYPDYADRDYPADDYYDDDRGGRSFEHDSSGADYEDAEDFMMKQLKSTIPGTPGVDYALYQSVPDTSFRCESQTSPGFYGDVEAQCQVFHICQDDDRQDSFLCPLGTVFNQISFICDWWFNFKCEDTPSYYHLNDKFDSSEGSTSMKDAMKRMRSFHDQKDMRMIMGIAKVHKKLHSKVGNMVRNRNSAKHSMSPKIRNLFMLRMRKDRLERIRNTAAVIKDSEEFVTASTSPVARTPLALKAMSSTGYLDISQSEYTTTNNMLNDSNNASSTPMTPSHSANLHNTTENSNYREIYSSDVSSLLDAPFKSLLHLPGIEMIINGSIITTVKLDHPELAHLQATESSESQITTAEPYSANTTNEVLLTLPEKNDKNTENEFNEDSPKQERETEYAVQTSTHIPTTDSSSNNYTLRNEKLKELTESTSLPPNKPFKHQNNFIFGNDTHISVSVTIRSKSGHSKLQWKRLPGLKRVRKIRFKNEDGPTTPRKPLVNDAQYKKRNNEEKFRSRVMWIPAMKNSLDRRLDWKSFLESRTHATVATTTTMKPYYSQPLKQLAKATLESSEIPPINISDMAHEINENKTDAYHEYLTSASVKEEIPADINATSTTKYTEANIFTSATEEVVKQSITVSNFTESNTEIYTNMNENQSNEPQDNCKTICIKLLRSLHVNHSNALENDTLGKAASLTLFDYDSSETQNSQDYGRKSVLGISPSEQWTVKYEPGPNCYENTDDDKVLVKGWSVIIDTGYVTKEKTVKKRGCKNTAVDSRIILTQELDARGGNSQNEGIKFESRSSHTPHNSKSNYGSTDQQYWLNLVKNWLEQSPKNKNKEGLKSPYIQSAFSNRQQTSDEFSNSENDDDYAPHENILQERQKFKLKNSEQSNFLKIRQANLNRRNTKPNSGMINDNNRKKDSNDFRSFSDDKKRHQSNIQSSRTDWSLDLQTERSDWFRATRSANNWSNSKGMGNRGNTRDWNSDARDRTESNPRKDSRKGSTFTQRPGEDPNAWLSDNKDSARDLRPQSNTRDWQNEDTDYSDQDYDDRSFKKPQSRMDWIDSKQNEDSRMRLGKWDWADSQENWDSRSPQGRNAQNSRQDNNWSKGNQRMSRNNQNTGKWPATQTNDWSSARRNQQNSKGNDPSTSWKSDSGAINNKGKQPSWPPKSNGDSNSRSVTDEWNWPQSKGSMTNDNRNDWTSRTKQNKPSSSSFPKNKIFQRPLDEEGDESWDGDSISDWSSDDTKSNEDWRSSAPGNKGSVTGNRNSWNSDENDWSSEEDVNYQSQNSRWDNKDSGSRDNNKPSDWSSKVDNKRDWSSGSRGGRDKGFAVRGNEPSVWSSKGNPNRAFDEKTNDKWPSKSPKGETRPSVDRSSRRNIKGDSSSVSNKPRTPNMSQKSWGSGNQNNWKDDGKIGMRDAFENNPSGKGIKRLPTPARGNQDWKSDFPDEEEWLEPNKGQNKPKGASWNTDKDSSARRSPKSNTDWNTRRKMESDPWADRTPPSRRTKGQNRNTDQPEPWSKDNTPIKGTNTMPWNSKMPAGRKPKSDGNSWGTSKGSKGNTKIPQSSSSKGSSQPRPTMPWKKDAGMKNSTNDKGDSEMKKIVWSVQISSDGKPGNGWVPITLRPNLRGRGNGSQSDWSEKGKPSKDTSSSGPNSKGSPRDEDWKNKKGSDTDEDWDKRSSKADEDWSNKKSNVPKEENSPKDNDWSNKGDDQINKRRSSRNDDKNNKGGSSADEEWENKMSNQGNKGSSSSADIWDIGGFSTGTEEWNTDEENQAFGKSSSDDEWSSKGNDRDIEGISLTDDFSYEDRINPSANLFLFNQDTQDDGVTETDHSTTHMPSASFNRLLYIPANNVRQKRENKNRGRHFVARDIINRTYKIIKSGEILDDASKHNNNFFVAKAGIIVTDSKYDGNYRDTNVNTKQLLDQNSASVLQYNSASDVKLSPYIKNNTPVRSSAITNTHWDTLPKESVIRERWSSPLISSNVSASGWIPVTAFRAPVDKQFTAVDTSASEKNKIINETHLITKSEESTLQADVHDLDLISAENISQSSYSFPKTFNILLNDKDPSENKNGTEVSEHETELKVGNKTLRILSFSDVMKQLENEDNHPQSSQDFLSRDESWNMPVTSDPKTYSLKLIDLSNETRQGVSNSWMFPSNENGTKQAWVLVEKDNATRPVNRTSNEREQTQNTDAKTVDSYRIIVGNTPTKRNEELSNQSQSSLENKAHSKTGPPQFTFTNWDENSDWTPIIRSIGRVVTFNRTLPHKEEAIR